MQKTVTSLDNIKDLHEKVPAHLRDEIYLRIAQHFNTTFSNVRINWFSAWRIPDKYRLHENLILFMQKFIANQNSKRDER